MAIDRNAAPRRLEGWVARKETQQALRDLTEREGLIAERGMASAIAEIVGRGRRVPYPFNDQRRLPDIVEDASLPRDWRAAARWLLDEIEAGRLPDWPDQI